ncbi:MAG: hypothetical protein AAGA48_36350 [Myxococcota bacterium]
MIERLFEGPGAVGLDRVALALVVPLAVVPPTLSTAGLVTLLVAVAAGLLVAGPTVQALRRAPALPEGPLAVLHAGLQDLLLLAVLAGGAATALGTLPLVKAVPVTFAGWLLALWLMDRDARTPTLLGLSAVLALGGLATVGLLRGPLPLTALVPQWGLTTDVLAPALVAGLWMGGLGLGTPDRQPGTRRAGWATVGPALLGTLGAVIWTAYRYEEGLTFPVAEPVIAGALGMALVAAATHWLRGSSRFMSPVPRAFAGLVLTGWFAGPASGVLSVLATGVLPLGLATLLAIDAIRLQGTDRWIVAGAAGIATITAGLGFAEMHLATLLDASALAISIVAAFWFVATGLVRRRAEIRT